MGEALGNMEEWGTGAQAGKKEGRKEMVLSRH